MTHHKRIGPIERKDVPRLLPHARRVRTAEMADLAIAEPVRAVQAHRYGERFHVGQGVLKTAADVG